MTEKDITAQYQSFGDSTEALKDGKIDAAFIVAGAPTPAITELATTNAAYLVPIDGEIAETIMSNCPYYTTYTIPRIMVESMPKYSAIPPHTPQIFLSTLERYNFFSLIIFPFLSLNVWYTISYAFITSPAQFYKGFLPSLPHRLIRL